MYKYRVRDRKAQRRAAQAQRGTVLIRQAGQQGVRRGSDGLTGAEERMSQGRQRSDRSGRERTHDSGQTHK